MKIKLGEKVYVDLDKLIESRLLVQANSGGGKSWAIRRLIEQAFGKKQIIVIDPEGEFGNLRSEFDFVYAGKGGDAPVESRSAALLVHRLLELKASAIIDLYELPPQERKHYVRLLCTALVNAPKELWQDVLVIIDEAHVFAPEKGESEALGAVIDIASRGRKRGYCVVLATQRPAKLNKDAAAECNNKLIGRASLDIDRKRAAEELGFTTREQVLSLRDLEPGDFYAFGPAISRDVEKVTIGDVKVKPPKRGVSKQGVPAPSDHVKKILGKLADLPQEAAKEAATVAELKAEVKRLERDARMQKIPQQRSLEDELQPHLIALESERKAWAIIFDQWEEYVDKLRMVINTAVVDLKDLDQRRPKKTPGATYTGKMPPTSPVVAVRPATIKPLYVPSESEASNSSDLTGPEQRILDAIALSGSIGIQEPEQTAVAFLAGYTYGGGGFNNPRGALKTKGFVEYRGSKIALTEAGHALANIPEIPLTGEMLRAKVLSIIPGPERKLFAALLRSYPEALSNEELSQESGYANGSGGFNSPRGRLKTLGLIEYTSGKSRAKDFLFP